MYELIKIFENYDCTVISTCRRSQNISSKKSSSNDGFGKIYCTEKAFFLTATKKIWVVTIFCDRFGQGYQNLES